MAGRFPAGLPFRAWPLEASWHPSRQQGIGVLVALLPILRRSADRPAALARHAAPFGCNLWTAPLLLGAMARLEEEGRGAEAADLRDRLSGPLSGAGDLHVWKAVRPAALALVLAGVLFGQPLAGFLVAWLLHALALGRTWHRGFRRGWALGTGLEASFAQVRPNPRLDEALRSALGIAAGALAGWGLVGGWQTAPSTAFLMSGALVLGYHAARRSAGSSIAFLGWVLLASVLGRFSNPVGLP